MTIETWIATALAAAAMLAIPGPTILLVLGQSLGAGKWNALPLVAGVALGDPTAMGFSLAGFRRGGPARFAAMAQAGRRDGPGGRRRGHGRDARGLTRP